MSLEQFQKFIAPLGLADEVDNGVGDGDFPAYADYVCHDDAQAQVRLSLGLGTMHLDLTAFPQYKQLFDLVASGPLRTTCFKVYGRSIHLTLSELSVYSEIDRVRSELMKFMSSLSEWKKTAEVSSRFNLRMCREERDVYVFSHEDHPTSLTPEAFAAQKPDSSQARWEITLEVDLLLPGAKSF